MSIAAIQIDRLRVARGRRVLLSLDHWSVGQGQLVAVLGPNGAGKSTLLRCCVGMAGPVTGSVRVLGQQVDRRGVIALTRLRRRVAYLAQVLARGSEMPLTLREVVSTGRTGRAGLFRRLKSADWDIVDQWIERLGLQPVARRPYGVLSGGEQRKALLAMAMVQQPEVLLLDEPSANLDVYWREQVVSTLDKLQRQTGLTVVLVCHELETLPTGTERVLVLRQGQLLREGAVETVINQSLIETLYGPGLTVSRQAGRYLLVPRGPEGSR
jgi:ABC-type cobalamin/Fe3+-siderophores transport system ATPase subunit